MDIREVRPKGVASPVGSYAHAVSVPANARMIFISGQIPTLEDGSVPKGIEAQAEAVWENIGKILSADGLNFANLAKVTTYLSSRENADINGRVRRKYLREHKPALTVIIADIYDPEWLLEIEAIAIG